MGRKTPLFISIGLILLASIVVSVPDVQNHEAVTSRVLENSDWHAGSDVSTDDYEITYSESADGTSFGDQFTQEMTIEFKDGTEAEAAFMFQTVFDAGGLDVEGNTVQDWSKATSIYPQSKVLSFGDGGKQIETFTGYWGFSLFKGNASEFSPVTTEFGGGNWALYAAVAGESQAIAQINYGLSQMSISAPEMSTATYDDDGTERLETTAKFTILIDADFGPDGNYVILPASMDFTLIHNYTHTTTKYGVDLDWTGNEEFPTHLQSQMESGDPYLLVSNDVVQVFNEAGSEDSWITTFEPGPLNQSAVFSFEGEEVAVLNLPTSYDIKNGPSGNTPTAIYFEEGWIQDGISGSTIFQIFDGFTYNESSGLFFDPELIQPNGIPTPWVLYGMIGGGVLFVLIVIVIVIRRRGK